MYIHIHAHMYMQNTYPIARQTNKGKGICLLSCQIGGKCSADGRLWNIETHKGYGDAECYDDVDGVFCPEKE